MKNYTGLQKIKASEVIDTFKEEVVTEETFAEKVAKGYLYKGFEPPENATMLKFRYYSPEKVLIEQNNVPVVYDGTSITDVINYYYLTDKSSGVTFDYATKDSYGWTTGIQTVTKDKRFLWSVTETRYSNTIDGQAGTLTEPCIISIYGEKGERGAIYLGHYTDNQACYEANKPAVFSGDYYLNTTDGYIYTYDDESNKWAKISDYADYRYSIAMNDIIGALQDTKLTNFITAKTGWFENLAVGILRSQKLFSKEITLTDGGLIQSDGFQSGKSGWQIDYNGKAEFNDTTVRGKIYASDGEFKGKINAATITGGKISGTEISGGTIKIGENFSVNNNGDTTMKNANIEGYIISAKTPFKPCCSLNIGYNNNSLQLYNGKNIKSVNRDNEGIYTIYFKNPLKIKVHKWNSNNYIDLFVVGNCHDSFSNGFKNQIMVSINWVRNYVDNRLAIENDEAIVTYATLYFADNNNDDLQDPISAQVFIFATETD